MGIKLGAGIRIDIPTTAKGWICKLKGHSWGKWIKGETNATKTTMTRVCARCGAREMDQAPV